MGPDAKTTNCAAKRRFDSQVTSKLAEKRGPILGHTHILGGPIKWDLERVLRLTANRAEEQVSLEGAMSMSPVTPTANVSFLLHVMWKTEGTS